MAMVPPPPPLPTPLPPPPPPAQAVCPSCHSPVDPSSRFCNRCGASLTGAPPGVSAASAPPVDIRTRVDDDRGVLKRVQLLIPGFRGYRQGEDIREADSVLRLQIADKVHQAVATVQELRSSLVQANQFQGLTDLAPVLSDLQRLEGEIRHAEQGYTGIAPAVRVVPAELDRLYEYDYGFAQAADQVTATLGPLQNAANGQNGAAVQSSIVAVRMQVNQLDQAFKARMRAIEGVQVP